MKKFYYGMASALLVLTGCTSDDYLGTPQGTQSQGAQPILFSGMKPNMTRAIEDGDAAKQLNYQFQVYGVKTLNQTLTNVFAHNGYSDIKNTPYNVWYTAGSANSTESNTSGWEYVGAAKGEYGTENYKVTLAKDQTIKYWDTDATQYQFVAYSNAGGATITDNLTLEGFTVTGTAAQMKDLYIADKVTVANADYVNGKTTPVELSFSAASAKVRLGFYETVPGYKVTSLTFKNADATPAYKETAILHGKIQTQNTYTVTYDNNSPLLSSATAALTDANSEATLNLGDITVNENTVLATTSAAPTYTAGVQATGAANEKKNWTPVLPSTNNEALTLDITFVLTSEDGTGETITIEGATASIPKEYLVFKNNYAYTYIFKISDQTAGDDDQLYPITFDAMVVAPADETQEGWTSTIDPKTDVTIATYQEGSVKDDNLVYDVAEQIFVSASEITANGVADLNLNITVGTKGYTEVYSTATKLTENEAEEALSGTINTNTYTKVNATEEGSSTKTGRIIIPADDTATATKYYIVKVLTDATTGAKKYAYKVITAEKKQSPSLIPLP